MGKSKKYGDPYPRKDLLKHGSIKKIADTTNLSYHHVVNMLAGTRTITPLVKALADKYADETQNEIDSIQNS